MRSTRLDTETEALIRVLPQLAQALTGHETVKILPLQDIIQRNDAYDTAEDALRQRIKDLIEQASYYGFKVGRETPPEEVDEGLGVMPDKTELAGTEIIQPAVEARKFAGWRRRVPGSFGLLITRYNIKFYFFHWLVGLGWIPVGVWWEREQKKQGDSKEAI